MKLTGARSFASPQWRRLFSTSSSRQEIRSIAELPARVHPTYQETRRYDLLSLQWPSPPANVLLTKKRNTPAVTTAFVEFAKHIHSEYPTVSIVLERHCAEELHESLPFPVYTNLPSHDTTTDSPSFHDKVDLVSTLGGDGTILRASSLFATAASVPPILSFGMGTLGFLGEWKFQEHKRAFREVFMSGAGTRAPTTAPSGWSHVRGKFMGTSRNARVLLRNRLKIGVSPRPSTHTHTHPNTHTHTPHIYAMNEVILHRGRDPHLAIISISIGGRHLTEAVADGLIISTPTGSTAYSLSSGGSIVHPLVSSLLLTPICPRSLSFRPLVLPANTPVTLRLSEKNRSEEVEVSVDGVRRAEGLRVGMELRVCGEEVRDRGGRWVGGVPSIVRGTSSAEGDEEDSWVGGLNGLLKFNHPFGEDA